MEEQTNKKEKGCLIYVDSRSPNDRRSENQGVTGLVSRSQIVIYGYLQSHFLSLPKLSL